ncbi:MAG: hypothetical protein ABEH35_05085 [Haloarculaceae archaeon]
MSDASQSGRAALLEALEVRRNARRGVVFGVVFAVAVFVFFVVVPGARSPLLYAALAFVLAASVAGLATAGLVAARAVRLLRE